MRNYKYMIICIISTKTQNIKHHYHHNPFLATRSSFKGPIFLLFKQRKVVGGGIICYWTVLASTQNTGTWASYMHKALWALPVRRRSKCLEHGVFVLKCPIACMLLWHLLKAPKSLSGYFLLQRVFQFRFFCCKPKQLQPTLSFLQWESPRCLPQRQIYSWGNQKSPHSLDLKNLALHCDYWFILLLSWLKAHLCRVI